AHALRFLSSHSLVFFTCSAPPRHLLSFPTRRSSDLRYRFMGESFVQARLGLHRIGFTDGTCCDDPQLLDRVAEGTLMLPPGYGRSEEHTSELQSLTNLVCRLLLEKKNNNPLTTRLIP